MTIHDQFSAYQCRNINGGSKCLWTWKSGCSKLKRMDMFGIFVSSFFGKSQIPRWHKHPKYAAKAGPLDISWHASSDSFTKGFQPAEDDLVDDWNANDWRIIHVYLILSVYLAFGHAAVPFHFALETDGFWCSCLNPHWQSCTCCSWLNTHYMPMRCWLLRDFCRANNHSIQCMLTCPWVSCVSSMSCNTKTDKNSLGVRSLDSSISAPSFRRYFAAASRCPSHLDPEKQGDHIQLTKIFVEPQKLFFRICFAASRTSSRFQKSEIAKCTQCTQCTQCTHPILSIFNNEIIVPEVSPPNAVWIFPLAPPVLASDLAVSTAALLLPQGAKMR